MVGARGFEPPASRSRTVRSTKLSYAPTGARTFQAPGVPGGRRRIPPPGRRRQGGGRSAGSDPERAVAPSPAQRGRVGEGVSQKRFSHIVRRTRPDSAWPGRGWSLPRLCGAPSPFLRAGRRQRRAGRRQRRAGRRQHRAGRRQRRAGWRQRRAGWRQRRAGWRQRRAGWRQRRAGRRQSRAGRRQRLAGRRQRLAGRRQSRAGRRQSRAGWRLGRGARWLRVSERPPPLPSPASRERAPPSRPWFEPARTPV
jgi:hypothetical protein